MVNVPFERPLLVSQYFLLQLERIRTLHKKLFMIQSTWWWGRRANHLAVFKTGG